MLKEMNNLNETSDDPSQILPAAKSAGGKKQSLFSALKNMLPGNKNGADNLREAIEEYIEETNENDDSPSVAAHEKSLISNVLQLRDTTVIDVMIPRADIAAIDVNATHEELMALLAERQFSRIPVYRETLDDVLGTVHIKDILSLMATGQAPEIRSMIRPVPIVSPSLPVLDLLLKMQADKRHMVLVVDEHGGIDGLITVGDLIEEIVGEFEDEFDTETAPQLIEKPDGSIVVDARFDVEEFEAKFGNILSEEERGDIDTLGGLVFFTSGRVPARGEVIEHETGMVFEVLDADQRRISRLRVSNIPEAPVEE